MESEYQVGHLKGPRPDDPRFAMIEEAVEHAIAMSEADGLAVIAIWKLSTGEVDMIFYEGRGYM